MKMRKNSSDMDGENKSEIFNVVQNPLHAINDAPEPTAKPFEKRYAVAAADLMSQSMTGMSDSSARLDFRRGQAAKAGMSDSSGGRLELRRSQVAKSELNRSHSFTLQGGSSTRKSATATGLRRNTTAPVVPTSPNSQRSDGRRRPTFGSRDFDNSSSGRSALEGVISIGEGSEEGQQPLVSDHMSDSSGGSYVANLPSTDDEGSNRRKLSKQGSSLSGKNDYVTGSVNEYSAESEDYDDEDDFGGSVSTFDGDDGPVKCCGIHAPQCRFPLNRIASALVRYAPCFWCFPIPIAATDRTILTRLNIISAFLSIGQVISTSWLIIVMIIPPNDDERESKDDKREYSLTHGMAPNLWTLTGSMYAIGFFGTVIFVSNLVTLKVIQVVNLVGAIRYLWVLLYLLPFEIFFVISIFDFYEVTAVWIKHWWRVPSMAWFREIYCPPGTAEAECMVPIILDDSADYSEEEWCMDHYNATNCTQIRDDAQADVYDLMSWFYNANVAWGFVLIFVLGLIVNTLERIISRPMVQKSRESNVPAWLSLPFLGSSVVGIVFRYSPSSVLSVENDSTYAWVGTAYMTCGVLFLFTAALGWFISSFSILSGRDKRYKHLCVMVFIFLMAVTSFILTVIFVASISYSVALVDIELEEKKDEIACGVDTADSCSHCNDATEDQPLCPEWTLDDVTAVLRTQTKGSASLSLIFFIYSFSALRFGFVLRRHITMYQIDYV